MNIYVASSCRNERQSEVVKALRKSGHEVYDFRQPTEADNGFHWSEIDPEWQNWGPHSYRNALQHPLAVNGFQNDYEAMQWSDVCVLVMPCGRSAHLEAGYFVGQPGKRLVILLDERDRAEPELMYKMADFMCDKIFEVNDYLDNLDCQDKRVGPPAQSGVFTHEPLPQSEVDRLRDIRPTAEGNSENGNSPVPGKFDKPVVPIIISGPPLKTNDSAGVTWHVHTENINHHVKSEHQHQVEAFMLRAGQDVPLAPVIPSEEVRLLRAKLILEEAMETILALGMIIINENCDLSVHPQHEPDLTEIIDGCCDLAVIATGTLSACGVADTSFQQEVNGNNLEKFGPGCSIREDGKVVKPAGHKPPRISEMLAASR